MSSQPAALRFENVSKSFGATSVLQDVSFQVNRGTALCILGRSGTGKSVTLKLALGLLEPDAGRIFLNEAEITSASRSQLMEVRKSVGFLFQNAALFDSITVGENVAFPLKRHTDYSESRIEEMVRRKLAQVGLEGDIHKMPNQLSGGMQKRAALARAMALDPTILFADEPSSGLDPITSDEIDRLLLDLKINRNTTLVIVTHNVPSARRIADVIAVLERGRIAAFGSPEELMRLRNETVHRFMTSVGAA